MKVVIQWTLLMISVVMTGCASAPFTYVAEKPVTDSGVYAFSVGDVSVDLVAEKQPEGYLDAQQLADVLSEKVQNRLQEKGVYAADSALVVNVNVIYQRKFGYGDSLARPVFSYELIVIKAGETIATRSIGESTTDHGYLGQASVNAQIATGNWDEEDEPEDIDMIALSIANDLEKF